MNYDGLQNDYWQNQGDRVEQLREKIRQRPKLDEGRTVPEDESLSLGDGKRLKMAVMFLDICGYSGRLNETTDEQDLLLRVLNLFFSEMIRIAEEYGGNVEKNTGDGLMVYFNDGEGNPPENGVKRAVACALTMMAANRFLISPILLATPADVINFRVSIDYGTVTVARLGPPRRFNSNVAIGSTANFACKMLQHANANEVVIGESAREALPLEWKIFWTQIVPIATGWVYRTNGKPYLLYRYIGRWNRLI